MNGYLNELKSNKFISSTKKGSAQFSHLKVLIFLCIFSGISSFIGYLLLGMFGNSMMVPAAFLSPLILFYIYTLCSDIINPQFVKFSDSYSESEILPSSNKNDSNEDKTANQT
jgi:uncharacterized membrane protein YfcA